MYKVEPSLGNTWQKHQKPLYYRQSRWGTKQSAGNMPKAAQYRVVWYADEANYQLHYSTGRCENVKPDNLQEWSEWLRSCTSFSFKGQRGSLNLLKEKRRDETYWYAYRRHGRAISKKYAGRANELNLNRLEELAETLNLPQPYTWSPKAEIAQENGPATVVPQKSSPKFDSSLLLAPKLSLPRLHTDLILRQRLLSWLNSVFERKLTLVVAPAGYGKTTLVRQWLKIAYQLLRQSLT